MNISLNEETVLNCTAIATFINWEINGETLSVVHRNKGFDDSGPIVVLDEISNRRMRTLRVVGSHDSNGSNITCFAFLRITPTDFNTAPSEPTLILV